MQEQNLCENKMIKNHIYQNKSTEKFFFFLNLVCTNMYIFQLFNCRRGVTHPKEIMEKTI